MRQFTEIEIKMAGKAKKIQKGWQPSKGDCVARPCVYQGDRLIKHCADSIVITKIGDCEADGDFGDKVAVYYARNPITKYTKLDEVFYSPPRYYQTFFYWHDKKDYIWLPLEHQLWEMLGETKAGLNGLCEFYDWAIGGDFLAAEKKWHLWTRWELLLAFVMHELFQKRWNGEKWVKE